MIKKSIVTKFYSLLFIGLILCITQCGSETKLDSDKYETSAERVEILSRWIKSYSPIKDAEFELFNVNGFDDWSWSIPGPSALNYKFAVKVDTADVSKWYDGMTEVSIGVDSIGWTEDITQHRKENWQTSGTPRYYERTGQGVKMIVYPKDGILFKKVIAN